MFAIRFLVLLSIAALAGCAAPRVTQRPDAQPSRNGGYYKDDGPGAHPPADLAAIPDAVPRHEALHRRANDPYEAFGKTYTPIKSADGYRARGLASWYGRRYHGKPTAIGEPYDMYAMSAAHATLPIPSYARVTNLENGKSVVVRINDRGPFHDGRIIDVSYTVAWKLGILKGVTPVEVVALNPDVLEPIPTPVPLEVVTAAPLEVEPSPVRPTRGLYLQLAAVSTAAAADALSQRTREHYGSSLPGIEQVRDGGYYKIQAGPYASPDAADQMAASYQQDFGVRPFRVIR